LQEDRAKIAHILAEKVAREGGRVYYVGGCVRDKLLGRESKDIDLEVHGVTEETLCAVLDTLGELQTIGASFGIYALKHVDLDIAFPRREDGKADPFIGTYEATRRRDLTVNSLLEDVLTGEITDHFRGRDDMEKGILRHVDASSFVTDPLRVYRAAQLAARFGFDIADETVELCAETDTSEIARERVFAELEKALLMAERPSVFFEALRKMNKLDTHFSELNRLIGVPQPPEHHPEGDVWVHTMMVTDAAAKLRAGAEKPLYLMLSALCHDLGKPDTTEIINGRLHSIHHETVGADIAEAFLSRLTGEKELLRYVRNMTERHMLPNMMVYDGASQKSWNRLFDSSVCPEDLLLLARADYFGCGGVGSYEDKSTVQRERISAFYDTMSRPYVMGRDLIAAGLAPGEDFAKLLAYAHKLRLAGVDKQTALKQTLGEARSIGKKHREI